MDENQYTLSSSKRKKGQHLQKEDRGAIQVLKAQGLSNRAIGAARVAVPQEHLHLVERVSGVHQKTGKRVAQIVYAHVLQAKPLPQSVPEEINIVERLTLRMPGEEPRIPGRAG